MTNKKSFTLKKSQVKRLVESGIMAPSGGNIQPWLVSVTDSRMTISINPKRSGNLLDVDCFGSILSLGCFIKNVEITAESIGLNYQTRIEQKKYNKDFKIHISFFPSSKKGIHPLYKSIKKRVTNRQLHRGKLIDEKILKKLENLVRNSDKNFKFSYLSSPEKKKTVVNILGVADAFRTQHQKLLRHMMSEVRWTDTEVTRTKDGMDIKTLELPFHAVKMLKLLKRFPNMAKLAPTKALEDQAKPVLLNSSHLCCLGILSKLTAGAMFNAGKTLQLLWLTATEKNLDLHPWTVLPFFMIRAQYYPASGFSKKEEEKILDLGKKIRRAFLLRNNDTPVFIFRLSTSKPPSARSLRIPWKQVTTFDK